MSAVALDVTRVVIAELAGELKELPRVLIWGTHDECAGFIGGWTAEFWDVGWPATATVWVDEEEDFEVWVADVAVRAALREGGCVGCSGEDAAVFVVSGAGKDEFFIGFEEECVAGRGFSDLSGFAWNAWCFGFDDVAGLAGVDVNSADELDVFGLQVGVESVEIHVWREDISYTNLGWKRNFSLGKPVDCVTILSSWEKYVFAKGEGVDP